MLFLLKTQNSFKFLLIQKKYFLEFESDLVGFNTIGLLTMEKSLFNKKVLAEKEHFHEKVLLYFHKAKIRKLTLLRKKNTVL